MQPSTDPAFTCSVCRDIKTTNTCLLCNKPVCSACAHTDPDGNIFCSTNCHRELLLKEISKNERIVSIKISDIEEDKRRLDGLGLDSKPVGCSRSIAAFALLWKLERWITTNAELSERSKKDLVDRILEIRACVRDG